MVLLDETLSWKKHLKYTENKIAKSTGLMVYNKDRYYHTKETFRSCNALNVYKLNLLNTSIFMHKIKTGTGPAAFHTIFKVSSDSYPHVSQV